MSDPTTAPAPEPAEAPDDVTAEVPSRPGRRGFMARWNRHPAVPTGEQLTRGERAADAMRNGMGSWNFVFAALLGDASPRSTSRRRSRMGRRW